VGMENLLPEDVLVNILHRLAPRCLAISRCVCKPWRTIIDARCLLRVDLLPHLVGGIFINFHDLILSEFISRPSIGPTISGNFNYLPHNSIVRDHCNGLLLLDGYVDYPATQQYYVVNPATRQWVQLPPCPSSHPGMYSESMEYLVFDPRLSSQFENAVYCEAIEEQKFEWDSDSDNVIDINNRSNLTGYVTFLGFHPYKEVVFLSHTLTRGLACHLNTRKVQDMGNIRPKYYGTDMGIQPFIEGSFPYTPWLGEFPEDN
uniref:F-box domain-containing protein n=1 Tax=Oryza glaberrima TaxID=4538 RepID=I1QE14_ORYGL